ncbi:hypothetical protein Q7C36_022312 [Tachysurus vachellii]|uniref:Uncharacterized protein n=1 Tax=Tachysurus vachellii TaxID=175792 RepID=A0AA88LMS2_TACVA|nr:hypothetical protein Q7C36_022312 [Tachysurus vachellii]
MYNNMVILREHYTTVINNLLAQITNFGDLEWQVAVKWARNRYKQKLIDSNLTACKQIILDKQSQSLDTAGPSHATSLQKAASPQAQVHKKPPRHNTAHSISPSLSSPSTVISPNNPNNINSEHTFHSRTVTTPEWQARAQRCFWVTPRSTAFFSPNLTQPVPPSDTLLEAISTWRAPAPIEVNQQETERFEDAEFPPLTHNWFSPPPSNPTTPPQPTLLSTTTLRVPSPRSPWAPKGNQVTLTKPSVRKQNPAVISEKNVPELSEINTHTGTQEGSQTTVPTRTKKPQQVPGRVWSPVVMVHPEIPNHELNEATVQGPRLMGGEVTFAEVAQTSTPEKVTTESQGTDEREVLIYSPPSVDSLLCTSQQDLNNSLLPIPQLTPTGTPESPGAFGPTRHRIIQRKMLDWSLNVRKKWCVVGDSNLSAIPAYYNRDLQIDSYPGATFRHAEAFISRANVWTTVEVIVLAFGINHRVQKRKETGVKELQRALKATKEKFPRASIWIPLINYSKALPFEEQIILNGLNAHIRRNMPFLPALPNTKFQVEDDQIHWTPDCAKAMLQHWSDHLNF